MSSLFRQAPWYLSGGHLGFTLCLLSVHMNFICFGLLSKQGLGSFHALEDQQACAVVYNGHLRLSLSFFPLSGNIGQLITQLFTGQNTEHRHTISPLDTLLTQLPHLPPTDTLVTQLLQLQLP